MATSQVPLVLDRYSPFLASFNLCTAALTVLVMVSFWWCLHRLAIRTLIFVILLSFAIPGSNSLKSLPAIEVVLPSIRLLAGVCLVLIQFDRHRRDGANSGGPTLSAATLVIVLSLADYGVVLWLMLAGHRARVEETFRKDQDLLKIGPGDLILVGDSYVWGQGVTGDQTVGHQLQRLFRDEGRQSTVYELAGIGAGLGEYVAFLRRVPEWSRCDLVILAYYHNDMPPRPRLTEVIRNNLIALGRGAPTLRLVGDFLARLMTPTVNEYHRLLIENYEKNEPTYDRRWRLLRERVREFRLLAKTRSRQRPLFLIIPIMVAFDAYALEGVHGELGDLAREEGFEVLDLLPAFRERLGDGARYRVTANDSHFGPRAHQVAAVTVKRWLEGQ